MSVPALDQLLGSLTASGSSTLMNFTTTVAAPAGTRIVCFVTWVSATAVPTTITGGGLTWTVDAQGGPTTDNKRCAIISADCPAGLASGTVIQVNFSAAATARSMGGASFTNCKGGSSGHVQGVISGNVIAGGSAWTTAAASFSADGLAVGLVSASTATNRTSVAVAPSVELFDLSPATGFDQAAGYRTGSSGTAVVAGTWSGAVTEGIALGVVYAGAVVSNVSYLDAGSAVGTFKVGQRRVGEQPVYHPAKPSLVLNGKAFITDVFAGDFIVVPFPTPPKLILNAKQVAATGESVASTGKPKLILAAKAYTVIVPVVAVPGKASLVLKAKPYVLALGSTPIVGKPKLYLLGKTLVSGEVALVPSIPLTFDLVPTSEESLVLTPTTEESLLLVPTTEEFR